MRPATTTGRLGGRALGATFAFLCLLFGLGLPGSLRAEEAGQEPAPAAGPAEEGPAPAGEAPLVRVFRLDGGVHVFTGSAFRRALERAQEEGAALFLFELDTPGGLVTTTQDMIEGMLNSPVPVVVYVAPKGAQAASAGFFLLLASDVAAMAPVTRTGAATPVFIGGGGGAPGQQGQQNDQQDAMTKKVSEDLAALLRSAALARGRPAELAEKAIYEAKAWSAEEALEAGLVELVVNSREELVLALDGREITRADGSTETLELSGARIVEHEFTFGEEFKQTFFNPVVMGLLLTIAIAGLYVELQNPGLIFPGVVGVAALLLFLYGSQYLPLNFFGAALILLGIVMFVLEIKVVSFGMLTLGGAISVGFGLYLLFDRIPGVAMPIGTLVSFVAILALVIGITTWFVAKAQARAPASGREGFVGEVGQAATAIGESGRVYVHGEYWNARAEQPIAAGARVRVVEVEPGMVLRVEPLASESRAEPAGQPAGS